MDTELKQSTRLFGRSTFVSSILSCAVIVLVSTSCSRSSSDVAGTTHERITETDSSRDRGSVVTPADIRDPLVQRSDSPEAPASVDSTLALGTSGDPGSQKPRNARELVMMRQHFDKTVWADEVKAQQYEQTFVKLWDALIFQPDKYRVLRELAFDDLVIGQDLVHEKTDWDINMSRFGDSDRIVSASQWPDFLSGFQDSGYEILETEWHHQRFEPAIDGKAARSVVSMLMHVTHAKTNRRFRLKGNLKIDWATEPRRTSPDPRTSKSIPARPGRIDASDVQITWREGAPAFVEELVKQYERDPNGKRFPTTIHPVILHDLDEDGLPEVVVGGWNLVYWNQGNFKFKVEPLCAHPARHPNGAVFADFTGDGVVDYLCCVKNGFPQLFEGQVGGKFPSEGRELKIADEQLLSPTGVAAGDIDGDGDVDVFIGQQKPGYQNGDIPTPYYDANDSFPSYLLVNDGAGNFRDVTNEAGLGHKNKRRNFSATFLDFDEDGDLDLMLTSDFSGTDLFYNDGSGNFQDVTAEKLTPRGAAFGMSHTFGDYNLDGKLDFMVIGMSSTTARRLEQMQLGREEFPDYNQARMQMGYGNRMYLYDGQNFVQAPFNDSVARTGWSWGSTTADFDCDGDPDVYVVNGQTSGKTTQDYCTRFWCHDVYYKRGERPDEAIRDYFGRMSSLFTGNGVSWNGYEHNALLMNLRGADYINVGFLMGVSFEFDSRCTVSGDLDGDGRVDLLVEHKDLRNEMSNLHFVRNRWDHGNHWIGVHLRQSDGSVSPWGASVTVELADGRKLLQHNVTGHSVWAQHASTVHFGLGKTDAVERVQVRWPNGTITELRNPTLDQYHVVRPGTAS